MRGLYAIIDVQTLAGRGIEPIAFASAICEARPAAIQVRDKRHAARDTLALLRAITPVARKSGVLMFANDRPDLAALAACDGVHLGQEDLPVAAARKVMRSIAGRDMLVGMSVHNAGELEQALSEAPDYLAFGPVFGTTSKDRPAPRLDLAGLDALVSAARARTSVPMVAIGGIDAERAASLTSVDAVAVISALLPDGPLDAPGFHAEVRARTEAIGRAFAGAAR